ncbi:manganese/iron ABC transporter ATP-binding protein [Paracoccus sp. (in: a-proteobacteria)]|uniref:manganese/iron ABC transporter ATP-binding protein n=1 Tax=Paracoccus sp. TaxID=267 RepID=UPI00272BC80F|nr:manganese/iron ABC transporter ATP-binding protein [Paracoccus sp. (in: a-proteobacteria)]
MSETPAIAVRDLTVAYRSGVTALSDASLDVPAGSVTALVGVNGAGKSTLFKALMGLVAHGRGEVRIMGLPVAQALRRNLVAYVPQTEEVDWTFPVLVRDVLMMGRYGRMGLMRRPRPADRQAVEGALARVGLTDMATRQIGELSGGQKKRVFLARALAQDARVILLDEPFTGVDVETERRIIALLSAMRDEGRAMLVSTHDLGAVPEYCDRVVMVKGTVLAAGPTATTFTPENLRRAFGGTLRHFVLAGSDLHDDPDARALDVFTDDERPLILYDDRHQSAGRP